MLVIWSLFVSCILDFRCFSLAPATGRAGTFEKETVLPTSGIADSLQVPFFATPSSDQRPATCDLFLKLQINSCGPEGAPGEGAPR